METRKKVCLTLPTETIEKMEKVKADTGLPVARQIDLALKGYALCRADKKDKEGCNK